MAAKRKLLDGIDISHIDFKENRELFGVTMRSKLLYAYLPSTNRKECRHDVCNGPSLRDLELALFDTLPELRDGRRSVAFNVEIKTKNFPEGMTLVRGVCATIASVKRLAEPNLWEIEGIISIPYILGAPNSLLIAGFFRGRYSTRTRKGEFYF